MIRSSLCGKSPPHTAGLCLIALAAALLSVAAEPATAQAPYEGPIRLTDHPAEDRSPSWSPDGERLLFASDRDGAYEIYSIGKDGTDLERLTHHPASDESPAWAPAGDRFVFQSDRDGTAGLWVKELIGGQPRLLIADESAELVPDWSLDGRWIAFMSERDGNPELYRVSVETVVVERLTEEEYRDVWPRYFPDGRSLLFFSRRATAGLFDDLFRLDLETRSVTRITEHPTHHDFVPDVSPDGERIVAGMSDREAGRRELVILDPGGQVLRRFADGYHRVFHPTWSPDGRWIAYAARVADGEGADLYLVGSGE